MIDGNWRADDLPAVIENVEYLVDWRVTPERIAARLQTTKDALIRRLARAGRGDLAAYIDTEPYDTSRASDALRSPF